MTYLLPALAGPPLRLPRKPFKRVKTGLGTFPKPTRLDERRTLCLLVLDGDAAALVKLQKLGLRRWVHKGKTIL